MRQTLAILLLFLLLTCSLIAYTNAAVVGIDLGTEFIKVGIVKPGSPVDVVLNEQSKRKTPATVGWRFKERHLGESAKTLSTRFPTTIFKYLNLLIGKTYAKQGPVYERYISEFQIPARIVRNRERNGTIDVLVDDNTRYSVEELMAMILQYVKKLSSENARSSVVDCVITIPPFYGIDERQSVIDAATLAGFNVLALPHETTAAALQYGFVKYRNLKVEDPKKPYNILIFDMGAASTKSVVASYLPPAKADSIELGRLTIKGVGWDREIGGVTLDARIAKFINEQFKKQHGVDITTPKAVTRVFAEAKRHKEILTANENTVIYLEALQDDKDLRVELTRDQLNALSKDVYERACATVDMALKNANMTLADISAVEVIGGGSRVIGIQKMLEQHVQKSLSYSLNGDEAIAIGAAYFAASLSAYYRVRTFEVNDIFPFQIDFTLADKGKEPDNKVFTLFKKYEELKAKKSINIPRKDDFVLSLKYDGTNKPEYSAQDIIEYTVTGVADAMKMFEEISKDGKSKVKVTFRVTESGTIELESATAILDYVVEQQQPAEKQDANNTKPAQKPKKPKKVKKQEKIELQTSSRSLSILHYNKDLTEKSKKKLKALDDIDYFKQEVSKMRNDLEAYLYATRSQLIDNSDEDYRPFYTEQDLDNIKKAVDQVDEWFNGAAITLEEREEPTTVIEAYRKNLKSLKDLCEPIYYRYKDKQKREAAFADCAGTLQATKLLLDSAKGKAPHVTEDETKEAYTELEQAEQWLNERKEKQASVPLHKDAIVQVFEIESRCKRVSTSVMNTIEKLLKKPAPQPEKPANETETIPPQNQTEPTTTDKSTEQEETTGKKPRDEF
jgi:hypoxia up-regulated 1